MDAIVFAPCVLAGVALAGVALQVANLLAHVSVGAAARSKEESTPFCVSSEAKSGLAICNRGAICRHAGQSGAGPPAAVVSLHTQNRAGWRSIPARACMGAAFSTWYLRLAQYQQRL